MKSPFLLCGLTGWGMEIIWTGLHAFISGDTSMMGKTSIFMFPIYGCASIIKPIYAKISHLPQILRGIIYTFGIYTVEYSTGSIFRLYDLYPWDYSNAPLNYKGIIRLDYFPVWFITGLIFEKILTKSS